MFDDEYKKYVKRIEDEIERAFSIGTTSTTGTTSEPLTMDTLKEVMASIPECPYKRYM